MSEPRRPPPPKSYVPLDLTTGPPQLPPRPTAADAGPPPNYTPPPPPMSDEEDEEAVGRREPPTSTPLHSSPAHSRPQPQPPTVSLPATHGGLRAPPSRPMRPPAANTPSLSISPRPPPPRPHPQATVAQQPLSRSSRSKTTKGGRPEITVMSAQPMTGEAIPLPTSPETVSPSHSLPPSHPPPSSSSPRVPARRAPARPPPSRKAAPPPATDTSPPLPAEESTDDDYEPPPGPVAPPRLRQQKGDEGRGQPNKPPLRKSHKLSPQARPSPALQNTSQKQAPPKPAPYRGPRPPPPRPQAGKTDKPREVKPETIAPRHKERESNGELQTENVEVPLAKQRVKQSDPSKEVEPATVGPLQAPQRTKPVDKGVHSEPAQTGKEELEQEKADEAAEVVPRAPQRKQKSKTAPKVDTETSQHNQNTEKDKTREVTPPKPRRAASKLAASSGASPPQPRPRAASASRPHFHAPPPPTTDEKQSTHPAAKTRPPPPPSSVAVPSKPRAPPPSRPPAKPSLPSQPPAKPDSLPPQPPAKPDSLPPQPPAKPDSLPSQPPAKPDSLPSQPPAKPDSLPSQPPAKPDSLPSQPPAKPDSLPSQPPAKPDSLPSQPPAKPDSLPSQPPAKPDSLPSQPPAKPGALPSQPPAKPDSLPSQPPAKPDSLPSQPPAKPDSLPSQPPAKPDSLPSQPPAKPDSLPSQPPAKPDSLPSQPPAKPDSLPSQPPAKPDSLPSQPPAKPDSLPSQPPAKPDSLPSQPLAKPDSSTSERTLTEQAPKPKRRSQLLHSASEDPTHTEKRVEPATGEAVTSEVVDGSTTSTNTNRGGERGQRKPGKPPPPRPATKSKEPTDVRRVPQRRMTMPSKPPLPRTTTTHKTTAGEEGSGEGVNAPIAKRRMTLSKEGGKRSREEGVSEASEGKRAKREEQTATSEGGGQERSGEVKEAVKKPARRRMPMVIRPMMDEEDKTDGKSSVSAKTKRQASAVGSSPKPARPPSRPTAHPSRKLTTQQTTDDENKEPTDKTQAEAIPKDKKRAPPKPSKLPPSPQSPVERAEAQTESRSPETPQLQEPVEEAKENISQENSEPQKPAGESTAHNSLEKSQEATVEEVEVENTESKVDGELDETTKSAEGGVVLRRKELAVTQLETYPKRSRPMSMPPVRPRKPPKPGPPQQGNNKPKPARPPARPSQGPARPSQGPLRPSQPARKAQTPATPVDPNYPPELPPRPGPGHILYKYVCSVPHGIALTSHEPTDPSELPYEADDVIELIERVDGAWFYARNADLDMCEGMIPARDLRVVRKLAGESTVSGFEEGPCAVAMFTFQGQTMDELSFKEGELIMLKTRVGRQWLRGKLVSGQEGIFPRNYVEIVEDLPENAVEEVPAPTQSQNTTDIHGPHCVAVYDFTADGPDELNLRVGDSIELIATVGSDWLRGRLGGQEGIFPKDFVEIKEDLPAEGKTEGLSKALFDFDGQTGELSFKAGERVRVTAKVNEEWVEGETEDGERRGTFPVSFVDRVPPDLPNKMPAPTEPPQTAQSESVTGKCEALFVFTAENAGELSFKTGDIITTLEWVNEEWMVGRIGTREGMFPLGFVKIVDELPKVKGGTAASKELTHLTKLDDSLLPRAEALRDFTPTDSNHLSFRAGDVLNLLERIGSDWYSGENTRTGDFGDFPASSVRVIEPLP